MTEQRESEMTVPIIVDLGKQKRKRIKALKEGRGRLMDEVTDVVDQVRESLGEDAEGKVMIPVVLLYRRRRRRRRARLFPF